jgi:hypothetical protein
MVGDEREKRATEAPDVEGHVKKLHPDDAPADKSDDGDDDDTPDVEAHRQKF